MGLCLSLLGAPVARGFESASIESALKGGDGTKKNKKKPKKSGKKRSEKKGKKR